MHQLTCALSSAHLNQQGMLVLCLVALMFIDTVWHQTSVMVNPCQSTDRLAV